MDLEDMEQLEDCSSLDDPQPSFSLEDDDPYQETLNNDDLTLPSDLEWLESLDEEDGGDVIGDGDPSVAAPSRKKMTFAKTARMFKLRRHLDQLDRFHQQKETETLKARQEHSLCRQNIDGLMMEREDLEEKIEQEQVAQNSAALFTLRAKHKHLCQKLQHEEELEGHIRAKLNQRELELIEVEVELGKTSPLRLELLEEEGVFHVIKAQKTMKRMQLEKKAKTNLQQHLRNKHAAMMKQMESECQKKTETGLANPKKTPKYSKEVMKRLHQQEAEKEQQKKELLEKRMEAVKSLKSNIAATHDSMRVRQSRAKANAQRKEEEQRQFEESLKAQGINAIKYMHQRKKEEETKCKQEEITKRQKSKRAEIVAEVLKDEELEKSRKRNKAVLSKPPITNRLPPLENNIEKLLCHLNPIPPSATEDKPTLYLREVIGSSTSSPAPSDDEDMSETVLQEKKKQGIAEDLAEPEFSGLWDQNYKTQEPLSENTALATTEVKMKAPACGKLQASVKKMMGKGTPFKSNPEIILFKDFELGKTYKKKVVLTNISYITNHCKLLGVSDLLKDFISITFNPPGALSPGMSCDMQCGFKPMINEDMDGEVKFVSAFGDFSVPIRCTIKKCDLEVDSQSIVFGVHVVGQTISRTITLTNKGALGTCFSLDTSTCHHPETSQAQTSDTQVPASKHQEISSQSITFENQGAAATNTQELQQKLETQELTEALQQEQPVSETSAADREALPDVDVQIDHFCSESSDVRLGDVREGEIGPFESIKLEVIFTPTIPGEAKLDFNIKFSDVTSKPIPIQVRGMACSVPVWVVQPIIDLKICMFDRLYQCSVMIQSRASAALKLTFEVCPEMRKHMEIVPKTGFIQAQSSFNVQLRFLPRCSLSRDAKKFFDSDTGVLEVPVTVKVAGQEKLVEFMVQAVVTTTDLQFDRTEVDFGYCSVHHSWTSKVRLTNLCLLPQEFGFLGVPEFLEVQPNDGFGTLLPQETLEFNLIFSPHEAKQYNFQISCKTVINRDFQLSCRGFGVRPPLKLSHSLIQFGATALGDSSTAVLHLSNHETSQNPTKQPLPPADKGAMAPAASRLFSFTPPKDSDISITPSTGSLLSGERCVVLVTFRPRLPEQLIKEEALRIFHHAKLMHEELEELGLTGQETKNAVPVEASTTKKISLKGSKESGGSSSDDEAESPEPDLQPGLDAYEEAKANLIYSFTKTYNEYIIPCIVSDGNPSVEGKEPGWRTFDTLYLKLQCPAVQPPLVVISENGSGVIDFQQVAVGERVIKKCSVQNISQECLDLRSSVLDIDGTFSLLNPLGCIRPGEKQTLLLAFYPSQENKYCDTLEVKSQKMTLELTLRGEGVVPVVTLSHPGDLLDFGYILEEETTSQVLMLQNNSVMAVSFRVQLASQSPSSTEDVGDEVALLLGRYKNSQLQPTVGAQNYSGLSVFTVWPTEGSIDSGESHSITVTFQPDHPSVNYSDRLTIELSNKSKLCTTNLKGAASSYNMYLYGGEQLAVPIESLLPPPSAQAQPTAESEMMVKHTLSALLKLQASYSEDAVRPAVSELTVGCIRSTKTRKKTQCEFVCDNIESLQQQGFTVEPCSGIMDAGQEQTITVTWTPQQGYMPYEVVQICMPVTLKGNETTVCSVTLLAFVSNTAE